MESEFSDVAEVEERESLIRGALEAILHSDSFQKAPLLGRLLAFLVEEDLAGRSSDLKEIYVGYLLYGRPADYDPKLDSVVRVNASRLRSRLLDYYAEHAHASPRIVMRPGSYIPNYEFKAPDHGDGRLDLLHARNATDMRGWPELHPTGHVAENGADHIATALSPPNSVPGVAAHTTELSLPDRHTRSASAGWLVLALCLGIAAIAAGLLLQSSKRAPAAAEWIAQPFSGLGGQEEFADISPSGRRLAYSWTKEDGAPSHIYLQSVNGEQPGRLTSSDAGESRPVWSPSGQAIAFLRSQAPGRNEVIVRTLSDGKERSVASLRGSYPWLCTIPRLSWSPDEREIFTSENLNTDAACGVVAIDVATGSVRPITQPPAGTVGDLEAAVSPNGGQVAFLRNDATLSGDIYVTSVSGGTPRRITFDNRDIMGFCWTPDGRSVIVSSRRGNGIPKLWQISLVGKTVRQLTDGLTLAAFPSISAAGNRIAFTSYHTMSSIWQVFSDGKRSLIADHSQNAAPQLSPDGRSLVYRSDRTGSFELWISQLDGQNGRQLTDFHGSMVNNPRWSPDGKHIAFECRPNGHSEVCLVDPSRPQHVTQLDRWQSNQIFPSWSRDGRSLYFASNRSGRWEIYRQAAAGGDPTPITHDGGMRALESRDGRWLYIYRDQPSQIVRMPVPHDGQLDAPSGVIANFRTDMLGRWDVQGSGVRALIPAGTETSEERKEEIVDFPIDTAAARHFGLVEGPSPPGDLVFSTAPDGKSILYVYQGMKEGDIGFFVRKTLRDSSR